MASLLNNFEIVATSVIALVIFRERISRRLWLGILTVMAASALLSLEDMSSLSFSTGSLMVLGACVCWGFENNCTRMMSHADPLEIVVIKGLSVYFYVYAQRSLGAAKTSAYDAIAPFAGVAISFLIFRENPGLQFFIALPLMLLGTWLTASEGE